MQALGYNKEQMAIIKKSIVSKECEILRKKYYLFQEACKAIDRF